MNLEHVRKSYFSPIAEAKENALVVTVWKTGRLFKAAVFRRCSGLSLKLENGRKTHFGTMFWGNVIV